MNNAETHATFSASAVPATFQRLIRTNIVFHNGIKSHILTMVPTTDVPFIESLIGGINRGLLGSDQVTMVHHQLLYFKDGELKDCGISFHPAYFHKGQCNYPRGKHA